MYLLNLFDGTCPSIWIVCLEVAIAFAFKAPFAIKILRESLTIPFPMPLLFVLPWHSLGLRIIIGLGLNVWSYEKTRKGDYVL